MSTSWTNLILVSVSLHCDGDTVLNVKIDLCFIVEIQFYIVTIVSVIMKTYEETGTNDDESLVDTDLLSPMVADPLYLLQLTDRSLHTTMTYRQCRRTTLTVISSDNWHIILT